MSQLSGSTQAALDYNSTILGALELSEKKWVLAVQLPGVSRHSRHVLDACGERLVSFVERLKAKCASAGRKIARVILTHEAGRGGFWLARFLCPTRYRGARYAAFKPPGGSAGATGKDRHDRRRDVAAHFDGLAKGRTSGLFDGSD